MYTQVPFCLLLYVHGILAFHVNGTTQVRQCKCKTTLMRVRATTVAVEKQSRLHIPWEFTALGIQHAMRMHHIVICSLSASTVFFYHIS